MMTSVHTERFTDEVIYARHAAELVRFATALIGPSGADDLVADAAIRVFTSPAWADVQNQRAYLYRAVLNEAHQLRRSSSRRSRRERLAAGPELVDDGSVRPEVIRAMQRLDVRQRAIVFFTYWQDRSADDIAIELGVSTRTVQRELEAAKRRLMEELR